MKHITPYNSSKRKRQQIEKMFDNIAKKYDMINHLLSFGMDYWWRKYAVKQLNNNPQKILDIATGTADFAISIAKHTKSKIIGIDISKSMIKIGEKKIKKKKLDERIKLLVEDAEKLPFKNMEFDGITAGFGVRNFENLEKGLQEMYRVLKKDGMILILEPSKPNTFPIKHIYNLYFQYFLPNFGKLISKDKHAYSYFKNSVNSFPTGKEFLKKLKKVGFRESKLIPLTFGIVNLYIAIK